MVANAVSMRRDVTYEENVTYVCGHPSRRTRKRVLLRMRAAEGCGASTISDPHPEELTRDSA